MNFPMTINQDLTITSQKDYRAMTRGGAAVTGQQMRTAIMDHYRNGGRFEHRILNARQDSATEGRALVRASIGGVNCFVMFFVLEYDSTDSIEYRAGSVLSSHLTLEEATERFNG